MIHYHVWFDLKPHVSELAGLTMVERFLNRLAATDEATTFQLLRNQGGAPRSRLPRYHALVQFRDDAQLAEAMRQQAMHGIHHGLHGDVIEVVTNFHVEIFSTVDSLSSAVAPTTLGACDI